MTLVSVRELGVPERLGLTFADKLPPSCRVASGARRRGPLWAIALELNIRSEILEYIPKGFILGFFKHVELATLFVNNGTRLDLPRTFLHCGFVLGGGDFGVRFVNPFALWADHNGFAFAHGRNFGRLLAALRLRNRDT